MGLISCILILTSIDVIRSFQFVEKVMSEFIKASPKLRTLSSYYHLKQRDWSSVYVTHATHV